MTTLEITNIVLAGTTFLAVLVALFGRTFWDWFNRPKLEVAVRKTQRPLGVKKDEMHVSGIFAEDKVYFVELGITNTGRNPAENVEVFLSKRFYKALDTNEYAEQTFATPINLCWLGADRNCDIDEKRYMPRIGPNSTRYCSLGWVYPPKGTGLYGSSGMGLDITSQQFEWAHLLLGPAWFKLIIEVSASNARPVIREMEILISGNWSDEEEEMFKEHLRISLS